MKPYFILLPFLATLLSCSNSKDLIPIEVDLLIGEQFSKQMEYNPMEGKILDSATNPKVYQYIYSITHNILKSDNIKHKNDFKWQLKIIENDSILNAFCISGGYIYVYTGLIKFLDNEAELAGVLAHEIAHADNRHSIVRLVSQYGISTMIGLMTGGDVNFLVEIGSQLLGLTFSRADEKEADEYAVSYLYSTDYDARAVGGFFNKMVLKKKDNSIPEFLSTHPASENRIDDIMKKWKFLGSKEGKLFAENYVVFKKMTWK